MPSARITIRAWTRRGCCTSLLVFAAALPVTAGEREDALRRAVAWQVALDAAGFSPGLVDGQPGPKTETATREFQKAHGLPVTGQLDERTAEALKIGPPGDKPDHSRIDPNGIFIRYRIEPQDLEEIGPNPTSWVAKSRLTRIGHEALQNVIAEKFHCSIGLLVTLNPRKSINSMSPGDEVVVPEVYPPAAMPKAEYLEVNLSEKIIRVMARDKSVLAIFHCSVAREMAKLPDQDTEVVKMTPNPVYVFKPSMWPEVKERITQNLNIPPGPRNPVGRYWIGLGLPGYGMHGTPNPELIGKTGSHGCFRLTNWDAQRLARMVEVGTPVRFAGHPEARLARTSKTRVASSKKVAVNTRSATSARQPADTRVAGTTRRTAGGRLAGAR